jgi:general secretion pathway protein E
MTPLIYWGVSREAGIYRVAVPDIYDELALERIRIESGCRVIPEQHSEKEIRQMIKQAACGGADCISIPEAPKPGGIKSNSWESEPIINLVDSLIEKAQELKASDIHLEPGENTFRVRFRIDGML